MSLAQGVLRKQLTSLGHIGLFHFDRLPGRFVYGFGNWFTEKRQRKESAEKNWQNDSRQAVSHRKNKPRWKFEAGMKSDVHKVSTHLTQHFLAHQCCLSVRWKPSCHPAFGSSSNVFSWYREGEFNLWLFSIKNNPPWMVYPFWCADSKSPVQLKLCGFSEQISEVYSTRVYNDSGPIQYVRPCMSVYSLEKPCSC